MLSFIRLKDKHQLIAWLNNINCSHSELKVVAKQSDCSVGNDKVLIAEWWMLLPRTPMGAGEFACYPIRELLNPCTIIYLDCGPWTKLTHLMFASNLSEGCWWKFLFVCIFLCRDGYRSVFKLINVAERGCKSHVRKIYVFLHNRRQRKS